MGKINNKEIDRATIMLLSKMLPKPSGKLIEYSQNPFGYSIALMRTGKRAQEKNLYWCSDCGGSFSLDDISIVPNTAKREGFYRPRFFGTSSCPCCGKQMMIEQTSARCRKYQDIIAVHTTFGEWKVDRYYNITTQTKQGQKQSVLVEEIGQTWMRGGSVYHYIASKGGMFYGRWWRSHDPFHFSADPCDTNPEWCPFDEEYEFPKGFNLGRSLAKYGIDINNTYGLPLSRLLSYIIGNSHFETLWKAGEYEMATTLRSSINSLWSQIKIVRRNHYKIEDYSVWSDYIGLLQMNGKDINSPKYICPKNLTEAHNAELEIIRRREEERREEDSRRRLADAKRDEARFIETHKDYFGINIKASGFVIVVLKSVKEFKHEGDILHHCVFHSAYYRKEGSLILSARDADNNPIETIEVDLERMVIRQCYGEHDSYTGLHDDIVKAMNENMWMIKECRDGIAVAS